LLVNPAQPAGAQARRTRSAGCCRSRASGRRGPASVRRGAHGRRRGQPVGRPRRGVVSRDPPASPRPKTRRQQLQAPRAPLGSSRPYGKAGGSLVEVPPSARAAPLVEALPPRARVLALRRAENRSQEHGRISR